jgi:hypothetical protein
MILLSYNWSESDALYSKINLQACGGYHVPPLSVESECFPYSITKALRNLSAKQA